MALPITTNGTPRIKPGRRDSLRQAIALQRLAFDTALAFHAENTLNDKRLDAKSAVALATVIRAWDTARDAVRQIRGKPLPGSLRPAPQQPKRKARRCTLLTPPDHPLDDAAIKGRP